jgi:hypothetical protein
MSAMFWPPSANSAYRGSALAWQILVALGLVNFVRGGIHLFASDGGAGSIAGIDLSESRAVIVMLFAVMGQDQIVWGAVDLFVALRQRAWVPLLLALTLAKQFVGALVIWLYKPLPVEAPGKYGALAVLPVVALALVLSLRERRR